MMEANSNQSLWGKEKETGEVKIDELMISRKSKYEMEERAVGQALKKLLHRKYIISN